MASILDKYGIKEVADVVFYDISASGLAGAPVLYLDTLKVSTIEQTAETSYAQGGKGNANLIAWDYGKEINVTLEDALFSAKSMSIMFGNGRVASSTTATFSKTIQFVATAASTAGAPTTWMDATGSTKPITGAIFHDETGSTIASTAILSGSTYFATFNYAAKDVSTIVISASNFPGTYYVTGDTYARSAITGRDEYFQFIIPKAKVTAENTITLEAEGDPSVFSMNLTVLRPEDGNMLKLVKYNV